MGPGHAIRTCTRLLRSGLRDPRSGAFGRVVLAARQLRRAAPPVRTVSAMVG